MHRFERLAHTALAFIHCVTGVVLLLDLSHSFHAATALACAGVYGCFAALCRGRRDSHDA